MPATASSSPRSTAASITCRPCSAAKGYAYPNGFGPNGKGLTNNNNGKIITSRAYFRSWDPPQTANPGLSGCGDACAWPGPEGTSHGVHTASTAAGNIVTDVVYSGLPIGTISGVAPRAYVMSYKVFYGSVNGDTSFYNAEGIAALEDVVKDGADVLNNSWGNGPFSNGNLGDPTRDGPGQHRGRRRLRSHVGRQRRPLQLDPRPPAARLHQRRRDDDGRHAGQRPALASPAAP